MIQQVLHPCLKFGNVVGKQIFSAKPVDLSSVRSITKSRMFEDITFLGCQSAINIMKFKCVSLRFAAVCESRGPMYWLVSCCILLDGHIIRVFNLCPIKGVHLGGKLCFILSWNDCVFLFPLSVITIVCPC